MVVDAVYHVNHRSLETSQGRGSMAAGGLHPGGEREIVPSWLVLFERNDHGNLHVGGASGFRQIASYSLTVR
jgi:hypothetical protein